MCPCAAQASRPPVAVVRLARGTDSAACGHGAFRLISCTTFSLSSSTQKHPGFKTNPYRRNKNLSTSLVSGLLPQPAQVFAEACEVGTRVRVIIATAAIAEGRANGTGRQLLRDAATSAADGLAPRAARGRIDGRRDLWAAVAGGDAVAAGRALLRGTRITSAADGLLYWAACRGLNGRLVAAADGAVAAGGDGKRLRDAGAAAAGGLGCSAAGGGVDDHRRLGVGVTAVAVDRVAREEALPARVEAATVTAELAVRRGACCTKLSGS